MSPTPVPLAQEGGAVNRAGTSPDHAHQFVEEHDQAQRGQYLVQVVMAVETAQGHPLDHPGQRLAPTTPARPASRKESVRASVAAAK